MNVILNTKKECLFVNKIQKKLEHLELDFKGRVKALSEVKEMVAANKIDVCICEIAMGDLHLLKKITALESEVFVLMIIDDKITLNEAHKMESNRVYAIHNQNNEMCLDELQYYLETIKLFSEMSMYKNSKEPTSKLREYFFAKNNGLYQRIRISGIIYIEASGTYSRLVTKNEVIVVTANLRSVLKQLSAHEKIVRCHRSYAINVDFVAAFNDAKVFVDVDGERIEIPISRTYREAVFTLFPKLKTD